MYIYNYVYIAIGIFTGALDESRNNIYAIKTVCWAWW